MIGTCKDCTVKVDICNSEAESEICMKMMMMVYCYFDLMQDLGFDQFFIEVREVYLFFRYLEEKILPTVFDCAKRLHAHALKREEVRKFATGVEILEKWQHFILHLYVRVHIDILGCEKAVGIIGFSECPPCYVFLTLTMYFCEMQVEYLDENRGKFWKKSGADQIIFRTITMYWPKFLMFLRRENEYLKPVTEYFLTTFYQSANVVVQCFFYLTELNSDNPKAAVNDNLLKALVIFSHDSKLILESLIILMQKNQNLISNIDNSTIISEETIQNKGNQDFNIGKIAWIIKHKLLLLIRSLLNYEGSSIAIKVCILNCFHGFIYDCLQKDFDSEVRTLSNQSIITAIDSISIDLSDHPTKISFNYDEFTSKVLNICKKLLFSTKDRLLITKSLGKFFAKTNYYSDDIMEVIIKYHELNSTDVNSFCEILSGFYNSLKNDRVGDGIIDTFRSAVFKLFETVCEDDTMQYLNSVNYKEKKKLKLHARNVEKVFRLIGAASLLNDNSQFKSILTNIMKRTNEKNSNLLPAFALAIQGLCQSIEIDILLKIFGELNYIPFLVKFIQIYFEAGQNLSIKECVPILTLIVCLSDNGILHNHFSKDILKESYENFVYDYILPTVILQAVSLEIYEQVNIIGNRAVFDKINKSYWMLGKVIRNDIYLTGGTQSLYILEESIEKILKQVRHICSFAQELDLSDKLSFELLENILALLILRWRSSKLPIYDLFLDIMKQTTNEKSIFVTSEIGISHTLKIMEHLLDKNGICVSGMEYTYMENIKTRLPTFSMKLK